MLSCKLMQRKESLHLVSVKKRLRSVFSESPKQLCCAGVSMPCLFWKHTLFFILSEILESHFFLIFKFCFTMRDFFHLVHKLVRVCEESAEILEFFFVVCVANAD